MSWYDVFIPPEVTSVPKLASGDFKGFGKAQLGLGGDAIAKGGDELGFGDHLDFFGWDKQKRGYDDAIQSLQDYGNQARGFQMEGLNKAEGYYDPLQQRVTSIYGGPGSFRK